jgi:hypothetical protein
VYYAFPEMRHEKLVSISTEQEKQANVDYFLDYIRLLVEDKAEYVEWLVMWLADILVNPDDKGQTPVSVVLWGGQGAGKTLLCELMARLLGEKLVHRTDDPMRNGDIMAAAGDFNSTLKYKLFIEFEEINFKTHTQVADRIKALITERTHTITHKGQDSVDVRATERILFTTSAAGSVVIESGDRRYAAFAVSTRRIGDAQYWNEHYAKLKDQSYVKDVAASFSQGSARSIRDRRQAAYDGVLQVASAALAESGARLPPGHVPQLCVRPGVPCSVRIRSRALRNPEQHDVRRVQPMACGERTRGADLE